MEKTMKTTTAQDRALATFMNGETLTASQISSRFGVANPHNVVYALRRKGYAIHLNEGRKGSRGRVKSDFYRLGQPTKAVIAAGYAALAQ
jgi:hypothetical protein